MGWLSATLVVGALALCGVAVASAASVPGAGQERLYFGTYTSGSSRGVYQSTLDLATGMAGPTNLAGTATDPSFVAIHPGRTFLYAVNEGGGYVVAFSINPTTGKLTLLNQQSSDGANPCHVVVDSAGKNVLVANYTGGSVTAYPIQADGRLGTVTAHVQHPAGSHAHCVTLDAANRFALVCDLGLNRIYSYRFDPTLGTLTTNSVPWTTVAAGSGPRHLAFDPQYRRAYVICELSATLLTFNYDSTNGALTPVQTVNTLPVGYTGQKWAAEVAVHPSGRFVYASNRGTNTIEVFAVNALDGTLTKVRQQRTGATPRHFAIDPTGTFCLVANQDSNSIQIFPIDPQTGWLTKTNQTITISKPTCVLPYMTQPPQPVLSARAMDRSLLVSLDNGQGFLTYQLWQAPALQPGPDWTLAVTGLPGQTNFIMTNNQALGFIRASVLTNY